ncbi:SGNH/GDSL hydrolase family protein [Nocardioides sp. L-11A]|uniref:SGNH/GDSL hydrolase family protein n=1 Tax=Nocardioides sp. L-11A TaxID=3043848 RepID=UPI002499F2A7|nr:SGNH/GDSL hydrolase family protein [Nocardioides sp. L-11A]
MTAFGAGTNAWTAPTTGTVVFLGWGPGGPGSGGRNLVAGGCGGGSAPRVLVRRTVTAGEIYTGVAPTGPAGGPNAGVGSAGAPLTIKLAGVTILQAAPGGAATLTQGGAPGDPDACIGDFVSPGRAGAAYGNGGSNRYQGGHGAEAPSGGGPGGAGGVGGDPDGKPGTGPGGGGGGGYGSTSGDGGAGGDAGWTVEYVTDLEPGLHVDLYDAPDTVVWTAPASGRVFMEGYAGGGGGRAATALSSGGAGGEGGYYASAIGDVVAGENYELVIPAGGPGGPASTNPGTAGGDMIIRRLATGTVVLRAVGGLGATTVNGPTGSDRTASCVGTTINRGGLGLGRAANTADGGAGGNGAPPNGGAGGDGANTGNAGGGQPGVAPAGGGGGGANRSSSRYPGGAGARGQIAISYFLHYGQVIGDDGQPTYLLGIDLIDGAGAPVRHVPSIVDDGGVEQPLARLSPDLSIAARAVPSYCPPGHEAKFNVATGAFNWTPGNTANLAGAIAGAAAAPAHLVIAGDSISEGWTWLNHLPPYGITADRLHAWPLMMRDALNDALGLPLGGTGYVRAHGPLSTADDRWGGTTLGSGWTSGGHYVRGKGRTVTFASDQPGDAVAIMTIGGGSFTISVDGGAPTSVPNTALIPRRYTRNVTYGTHTITITIGDTDLYLAGAEVYTRSAGIRVHNVAQGGAKASGVGQDCWADTSSGYGNMLPTYTDHTNSFGARPDAVIIMLGGNDLKNDRTPAELRAAFETIAAAWAHTDTDIIICPEAAGSAAFGVDEADYLAWWTACMTMCLDHGWPMIDMQFLTGGYNVLAGRGFTGDAYGHLNTAGAKWLGGAYAQAILDS